VCAALNVHALELQTELPPQLVQASRTEGGKKEGGEGDQERKWSNR
jgi:hypothetical protein